jgi:hypothetical protein
VEVSVSPIPASAGVPNLIAELLIGDFDAGFLE